MYACALQTNPHGRHISKPYTHEFCLCIPQLGCCSASIYHNLNFDRIIEFTLA